MTNINEQLAALSKDCENHTVRAFSNKAFIELNDLRIRSVAPFIGPKANTVFRKHVMALIIDKRGVSYAAATGHYNFALKYVREKYPELVDGLGRPEDKKGGRKTNLERQLRASASL
jgi:hypothetical protein